MAVAIKYKGKPGTPIVSCTGKIIGVYKRKKARAYTRPGKCKIIKRK